MHRALLDPYQHRPSPVHRLSAAVKCAAALAFVGGVILLPRAAWGAYAAAGAALVVAAALSRVPWRRLLLRLLAVEPFALGVAALSLLQPHGVRAFAGILARSTLCLFAMVLLSATTRFSDILRVLWSVRVPSLLVTTLALMHRYLFVLAEESLRMRRARASRTFTASRRRAWKSAASVAGQLFVRSTERAERIYAAMGARGWR